MGISERFEFWGCCSFWTFWVIFASRCCFVQALWSAFTCPHGEWEEKMEKYKENHVTKSIMKDGLWNYLEYLNDISGYTSMMLYMDKFNILGMVTSLLVAASGFCGHVLDRNVLEYHPSGESDWCCGVVPEGERWVRKHRLRQSPSVGESRVKKSRHNHPAKKNKVVKTDSKESKPVDEKEKSDASLVEEKKEKD